MKRFISVAIATTFLFSSEALSANDDSGVTARSLVEACQNPDVKYLDAHCYPILFDAFNAAVATFDAPSNGPDSDAVSFLCLPVIRQDMAGSFGHYSHLTFVWLMNHPDVGELPAKVALNKATLAIYSCTRSRRFHPN